MDDHGRDPGIVDILVRMPAPVSIPPDLLKRPFTLDEARERGLTGQMLRGRRFRRVFRGVYVAADLPRTLEFAVDAARLVVPGSAVFSHLTAAALRGLPVPDGRRIHVTVPPGGPFPRVRGIVAHSSTLLASDTSTLHGTPVTRAERTFVDMGRLLGLVDLVILGDAMVRRGFTTAAQLRQSVEAYARCSGQVRRASTLVRARVDSPMETRTRLLLVLAGLPEPLPGKEILDRHHQWVATVDLAYPGVRVAIEYDGDLHCTKKVKWRNDVAAREALRDDLGWKVIVVTADDIYVRPHQTVARVARALTERGCPGMPTSLDSQWQDYFPRRGHLTDEW